MSITLHLDLPDALAKEASAGGLLDSRLIGDLIAAEIRRRRAATELSDVLAKVRAQAGNSFTEEQVVEVVRAVRKGRREREAGR